MPETKEVNKVIYGGNVIIDLTGDTVQADKLASGYTAHDNSGKVITGTSTFDSDTTDATVLVAEMLDGKTAYARGVKLTGTMPNRGSAGGTISALTDEVQITQGYHDGSGKVSIDTVEQTKLVSTNIRKGVTILGVLGNMEEDTENPQPLEPIIPTTSQQSFTPAEGYTCFREFEVKPIPYTETQNPAGGITVTIG